MPIILPPVARRQFIKGSLAFGCTAITASSSLAKAAGEPVRLDQNRVALLADTHISADLNLSYPGTKWPGLVPVHLRGGVEGAEFHARH